MSTIVPAVAKAIEEIRCTFDRCAVEAEPDGSGGAVVVVRGIPMGCPYVQTEVWIGFRLTFQYPYADVYPHFTWRLAERGERPKVLGCETRWDIVGHSGTKPRILEH